MVRAFIVANKIFMFKCSVLDTFTRRFCIYSMEEVKNYSKKRLLTCEITSQDLYDFGIVDRNLNRMGIKIFTQLRNLISTELQSLSARRLET